MKELLFYAPQEVTKNMTQQLTEKQIANLKSAREYEGRFQSYRPTRQITFAVTNEFLKNLEDVCVAHQVTRSTLIRKAIAHYISELEEQQNDD